MRFLPTLQQKAAGTAVEHATAAQYHSKGTPYSSAWSVERVVKDAFERVIWAFRAIDAIASNEARLPYELRKGVTAEDDGEPVASKDPLLRLLNRRANPYETAEQFRYRLVCQLLMSKKGVFVEVVRDNVRRVSALHLLPPDRTSPIPDDKKFVSGFRITKARGGYDDIPADRVLWLRKPHPVDPYLATIPLEAAGISIDLDFYARLYNRNFMLNDGRPGGIVGVKGNLNRDDAAELKRRFAGGPSQAGRTSVIEADEISYVDTATTPRDAQYVQTLKVTKEDILLAFGTPESVLGNASGRTYDNADAEEHVFWRATMRGYLDNLAGAFDALTEGGEEDDLTLRHNTRSVSVLQRDEKERDAKALADYQAGALSLDEYLELVGKKKLDVPLSRVRWVANAGKVPVGADGDVAAALAV
ncbi:MAG TPA: phage portal protein, partial [Solirubrobacteraceae bacterium]|nr:phage portal protein [Solirubrobacteraceae bacterium]